jgi:hypothetical protein
LSRRGVGCRRSCLRRSWRRNGEVAFIFGYDDEEGEARLTLDDGERELVVPVGDPPGSESARDARAFAPEIL